MHDAYRELSAPSVNGAACGNAEMSGGNGKKIRGMRPVPTGPGDKSRGASPAAPPWAARGLWGHFHELFLKQNADEASAALGFSHTALPWAGTPGGVEAETSQLLEAPTSKW